MAFIYPEPSRTFGEYLLIPNLTARQCVPANVDLAAPLVRFDSPVADGAPNAKNSALTINVPFTSALMQSVSGDRLAIALARSGGLSFIYGAQSIAAQAAMVARVKQYKAGFVASDSNLPPTASLADAISLTATTGHSTIAITDDGTSSGLFLGILTSQDYRLGRTALDTSVTQLMTPLDAVHCGRVGIDLGEANDLIWAHKVNCLPVLDGDGRLAHLVFRKDHETHRDHPLENVDSDKRLIVGSALNTRDYRTRVPALLAAGADIFCLDSSDGYSQWQAEAIIWIKQTYPGRAYVGAGNVVDQDGFRYLADAGADFIKVGIGGGSICITREQKGIGRGQASAVLDVAQARAAYHRETAIYVPLCSDGGIAQDCHVTVALAMGADFVMLGRYFARFDEAPGAKVQINNQVMKEYWGEGSSRACNWERYDHGDGKESTRQMIFEEGVDSYVPYAGKLKDGLDTTLAKLRSTLCNCGALSIAELQSKARLTVASAVSIREGGARDVLVRDGRPEHSNI
ncbi:IMP dehydrogenase [Sphingobium sp. SA2]|uniref:IMP dehydrogenase n=1 Tax=Sphingobium sp. SA2 TaxID=1524832 RepID=UPI0028C1110B|nr:IMP dehydrogenase [Sphingobium sp. SA2]MDT7532012.1 IMP dehydrogenase [Sphingobium sp. SA2]